MLLCNLALLTGAVGRAGRRREPAARPEQRAGRRRHGLPARPPHRLRDASTTPRRARAFEAVWGRPLPDDAGPHAAARCTTPRAPASCARCASSARTSCRPIPIPMRMRDGARARSSSWSCRSCSSPRPRKLAHVVLPGASFLEKDGTFTNGERRIQRVRGGRCRPCRARADWRDPARDLMAATGLPQPFRHPSRDHGRDRARRARSSPASRYERLEGDGLQWPVPSRDHPGTAILHTESFPRGRGRLSRVEYRALARARAPASRSSPGACSSTTTPAP